MKIKLPSDQLPFAFETALGRAELVTANALFTGPGLNLPAAAAFVRPVDPLSRFHAVQISRLRPSCADVQRNLVQGFELPCDIGENDEFLTAVIDALVEGYVCRELR